MLFLLCALLLAASSVQAATITISPGQSIQNAINSAGAGGTVILNNGIYTEGDLNFPSGSAGAPTTLQAATPRGARLRPNNINVNCIICLNIGDHHITVDGVILDGGDTTANTAISARKTAFIVSDEGQQLSSSVADITITNSEILRGRHSCFLVGGDRWTITNNDVHHCGCQSECGGNDDHGLYYSARSGTLTNNLIHDNDCYGIQNYSSQGNNVSGNVHTRNTYYNNRCGGITFEFNNNGIFANNVVYNNNITGALTPNVMCCGINSKVYYNTVVDNTGTGIEVQHGGTDNGAEIRNNIVCGNSSTQIIAISAALSNNLNNCSTFAGRGARDFHLTASLTVPCLSGFTTDKDLVTRPSPAGGACDAGAFEFGGGAPPTPLAAPTNLRITVN